MFVSQNQFFYFIQSAFIGVFSAFFYEVVCFFSCFNKSRILRGVTDVVFFVVPFYFYMVFSVFFCFPDFRFYMFCGVVIGFLLERISFHKSLAKVFKLVYNKTISFIRRKNRDGRKETKVNSRRHGNVCNTSSSSNSRFGISACRDGCKK